jgi:hypothetical protein
MTDIEQLENAIFKLETLNNHHPSFVLFSEAKLLYKTVPTLIKLLSLAADNWDAKWPEEFAETYPEWVELAKIVNEEQSI